MTGSLRSSRGKFYAVLNLKNEFGKRKQKSINLNIDDIPGNKRRAEKALREILVEYDTKHIAVYQKHTLFCDYIKVWLHEAKNGLQPNTYEAYQSNIDKHIYPFFKDKGVCLADLVYSDIKNYYNTKAETLSGNTLKKTSCTYSANTPQSSTRGFNQKQSRY